MKAEHGESLELMRKIKQAYDPENLMNPGKVIPAL
jgi:D-lactate dehydrogenase (cytochrome)